MTEYYKDMKGYENLYAISNKEESKQHMAMYGNIVRYKL